MNTTYTFIFTLRKAGAYKRLAADCEIRRQGDTTPVIPQRVRDLVSQGWEYVSARPWWRRGKAGAKGAKSAKKPPTGRQTKPKTQKVGGLKAKKLAVKPEWHADATELANLIFEFMQGLGTKSRTLGHYNVDVVGLNRSYLTGENPIDFLSRPVEQERRPVVVISPDISRSCAGHKDFTTGLAELLSKQFECHYVENRNGCVSALPQDIDFILYFGDEDYFYEDNENMSLVAQEKPCVLFSGDHSNYISPRWRARVKNTFWVDGVSLKEPKDYVRAMKVALKNRNARPDAVQIK